MKILVINGPNLNFLGIREKNIYGNQDYDYLIAMIEAYATEKGIEVECFQSNHEGAIIDKLQEAYFDGKISREDAIRLIKQNSRHYAKRQLTWFGADKTIQWLEVTNDYEKQLDTIIGMLRADSLQ